MTRITNDQWTAAALTAFVLVRRTADDHSIGLTIAERMGPGDDFTASQSKKLSGIIRAARAALAQEQAAAASNARIAAKLAARVSA